MKQREFATPVRVSQSWGDQPASQNYANALQRKENRTGLPDNLKSGIENLSGMPMDHVKVHYNSPKPAQLNAHAYTQGSEIHVAPGQEKHLPHEGWHVVQQAQGRVRPTLQMAGMHINDNAGLEREADVMGAKAASLGGRAHHPEALYPRRRYDVTNSAQLMPVIQMAITGEVIVAIRNIQQQKTNTCWATSGWVIDLFKGGNYNSEPNFVNAKGNVTAKNNYRNNRVTDIDSIIGSNSVTNRLSGSDNAPPFLKSGISRELGSKPIVANVNNNHYIVISGKRFNNNQYQIQYMDPANGNLQWVNASNTGNDNTKIDSVGAYALSVLYYVN